MINLNNSGRISGNPAVDNRNAPAIAPNPNVLGVGSIPVAGWYAEFTNLTVWGTLTINGVPWNPPIVSGAAGTVLTTDGLGGVSWEPAVHSLSFGTTGLLPSVPSSNDLIVTGILNIANGGTGITSLGTGVQSALGYAVNAANGIVLYSGNLGTPTSAVLTNATGLPLTTGVTGTLPTANGGTGIATVGASGTTLVSNGTSLSYSYPAQATNISGGAANEIPYQTATNTTAFVAPGVTNQVLIATTGSAPSWGSATTTIGTTPITIGSTALSLAGLTSITLTQDPTSNLQAATKGYVDSRTGALQPLGSAKVATTGDILLTGNQTIDTIPVVDNDIVLVRAQSNAAENGLYVVQSGAWTYPTYANDWAEYVGGLVFITQGFTYANTSWTQTEGPGGTLGFTDMYWAQISAALDYNAGLGIDITGAVISNTGVLSFDAGTTGLSPSVASTGDIVLSGTLAITNGGTGLTALGTGVQTALGSAVNAASGFTTFSGAFGTPTSITLTNATGLPLATGVTGTLAVSNGGTGITSFGTGVATALGNNVNAANGFVTFSGNLGTPTAGVLTNATGLPLTTGVSGVLPIANGGTGEATANNAFNALAPSQAGNNGKFLTTDGVNTAWALNPSGTVTSVDVSGGLTGLTFSGGPIISAGVITMAGTLAPSNGGTGLNALGTGVATFLGTPSSANLAACVTDETGSGALVFANTPSFTTPILGTPTSGTLTNCTGLPVTTGISGLGTNVATFLATPSANNLNSAVIGTTGSGSLVFASSPTLVNPILGTPQSGNFSSGTFTWPTFNQNTTGTAGNVTGVVAVANGGTNISSYTTGDLLYASGAGTLAKLPVGTSNQILGSDGTVPTWVSSPVLTGYTNSAAPRNTALGTGAGAVPATGTDSVFVGYNAGLLATTGVNLVLIGSGAGDSITSGGTNAVAIGKDALGTATTGAVNNIAIGASAMAAGASGSNNIAIGVGSGQPITSGTQNTLVGGASGGALTTGSDNVAIGYQTLDACNSGAQNTAVGKGALGLSTTGSSNVAVGFNALAVSTTTSNNVAVGTSAGSNVSSGTFNVLVGNSAGIALTTASNNSLIGYLAGDALNTGGNNTALGTNALGAATNATDNTAIGQNAGLIVTGSFNTFVGSEAGGGTGSFTGSYCVGIGYAALSNAVTTSEHIAIGRDVLTVLTSGTNNCSVGSQSATALTTGSENTTLGNLSLRSNVAGGQNVAIGYAALQNGTSGSNNIAIGRSALQVNTSSGSVGIGRDALLNNTTALNTAVGYQALRSNITSANSTAVGYNTLNQATGAGNTAIGDNAGGSITTGANNTLVGRYAGTAALTGACVISDGNANIRLYINSSGALSFNGSSFGTAGQVLTSNGSAAVPTWVTPGTFTTDISIQGTTVGVGGGNVVGNVAFGVGALASNVGGSLLIAIGEGALASSTNANDNIAIGYNALNICTAGLNLALGNFALESLSTGTQNTAIGENAGSGITTGSNNTIVGTYTGTATLTGACVISDGSGNIRLYTNNSGALSMDGASFGTTGQVLVSNGSSAVPTWQDIGSVTTGYWAGIYDTTASQTAAVANTAYAIALGNIDANSFGVSLQAGTQIKVANTGVYTFSPSMQVRNTDSNIHEMNLWFRVNGTDVPNSNSRFSITSSHGGTDGFSVPLVVFTTKLNANDYVELMWAVTNTAVSIYTIPAAAPVPQAPGVIVSVTSV